MNHFKQVCLTIGLCLALTSVYAQTLVGIKGQVNNFDAPLVIKMDLFSKTLSDMLNPGFGIAFQQVLSSKWAMQAEINYQEERQSYLLSGIESSINTSILKYIRVPILVKRNIAFEEWSIQTLAGPNFGYALQMLSGNTTLDYQYSEYDRLDFSDYEVKRFDLGLLVGLGVEKVVSKTFTTSLSLRYNFGVVDILQDDQSYFYNRGYTLEMAIFVPLGPISTKE